MSETVACGSRVRHSPHEGCVGIPLPAITSATFPVVAPLDDDTARELSRAAKQAVTWTERRNMLIREAVGAGAGVREVGRAVGLTHAAVINILRPRKRGGTTEPDGR